MPIIPTTPLARDYPLPEISPQIAGAPFGAVEKVEKQLEDLSQFGGRVIRMIKAADDRVTLSTNKSALDYRGGGELDKIKNKSYSGEQGDNQDD